MMKIELNEPESGTLLELEVNKVDIPSGTGWSVSTPKGRKVVIKLCDGEWKTDGESNISHEFWQTIGQEITRLIRTEKQSQNSIKAILPSESRAKRPRIWLEF